MASLLPPGEAQFCDANGTPYAGGLLYFYIPNTLTFKDTYQDAAQTVLNTNPVVLDAAGRAVIYGNGAYRQRLYDALGNLIWDQVTSSVVSQAMGAVTGATTTAAAALLLGIPVLDNIAALRSANASAVSSPVYVAGYYTGADGGGGVFWVDPGDATSNDNGGTIIVDAAGRRWYREVDKTTYSVMWFGAKGDGTTDDTAAFLAALGVAYDVYVPAGTYKVTGPLTVNYAQLHGAGARISIIVSSNPTATDPIIYAAAISAVYDLGLAYAAGTVTGSETFGQRVGIITGAPAGFQLQKGARIENVHFDNVGTAICDLGEATYAPFNVRFANLEITNFSFAGIAITALNRTGNVYDNIYINGGNSATALGPYSAGAQFGFWLGGNEAETTITQLNVEALTCTTAIVLTGLRAAAIQSIHVEEVSCRVADAGLVQWNNSSGSIEALTFYYCDAGAAGWVGLAVLDANGNMGAGALDPNTCNFLRVGALNMVGINNGWRPYGTVGLTGLSGVYFVSRPAASVGDFYLQIDSYPWDTFTSDYAVYQAFPNDPHVKINFIQTQAGPPVGTGIFGQVIDATAVRVLGTVYANTRKTPIFVSVTATSNTTTSDVAIQFTLTAGPLPIGQQRAASQSSLAVNHSVIVPPGGFYKAEVTAGTGTLVGWVEIV